MKSKKKAIILLALIILAIAATVVANRRLTQKLDELYGEEQQFFEMGETVPFADNYLSKNKVSVDGYSLRVDNAEVLTCDELLSRIGQTEESISSLPGGNIAKLPEKVCLITATLANEDSGAEGVGLTAFICRGENYDLSFDSTLTIASNAFFLEQYQNNSESMLFSALGIHLDPGTETTVYLVYDFYKGYFSARGWDKLEEEPLWLDITLYPIKETIVLTLEQEDY